MNECVDLNNTVNQDDIQEVLHMIQNHKSDDEPCPRTIDDIPASQVKIIL